MKSTMQPPLASRKVPGGMVIVRAAAFAAEKHRDQRRKSDDSPYINHPIRVADLLWSIGGIDDETVLAAALLHDTVEDTEATIGEIRAMFGPRIAQIVSEVTDNKSLSKRERKEGQIDRARRISHEAKLVKLADKLDNLTDMAKKPPEGWTEDRVKGYHAWAHAVCYQINRSGDVNKWLNSELRERFGSVLGTHDPARISEVLVKYMELMDEATD